MGKALIPAEYASAARDRILYYFRKYPTIIDGDELLVVSGIQEYARRFRELRVQFGWAIVSGVTIKEMREDEDDEVPDELKAMRPSEYVLLRANRIAKRRFGGMWLTRFGSKGSVRDKILNFCEPTWGRA